MPSAGRPNERFAIAWLLTLIGSLGVFVAGDLLTFYLVYALVSLPAYQLVIGMGAPELKRAAGVYMAFAILGEAFLLMAFALLAAGEPGRSLRIDDVVAALPTSPWRDAALALIIAGFGMKMALAPLNGWMPLTYTAAPIPAAAVLSGAGVKAGVIGLIRFLPLASPMPGWGEALTIIGFVAAFYGAAIGVTQQNPKTILAYSSISQMGVIAAALGLALSAGDVAATTQVAFYAANHLLVKGALFLIVGVAAASDLRRGWGSLILVGAVALSLAGLPFTGGAFAKLAVKAQFGYGARRKPFLCVCSRDFAADAAFPDAAWAIAARRCAGPAVLSFGSGRASHSARFFSPGCSTIRRSASRRTRSVSARSGMAFGRSLSARRLRPRFRAGDAGSRAFPRAMSSYGAKPRSTPATVGAGHSKKWTRGCANGL